MEQMSDLNNNLNNSPDSKLPIDIDNSPAMDYMFGNSAAQQYNGTLQSRTFSPGLSSIGAAGFIFKR